MDHPLFPVPVIAITDIQRALYKLDNLEQCRYYIRGEEGRVTYVYDRLLGYVAGG